MTIRFGTNINHQQNCEQAKSLLINLFGEVDFSEPEYSRDYEARPDDASASMYLNFLCHIRTNHTQSEVKELLKQAEKQMGRTAERKQQGIIDADFDILVILSPKIKK